MELFMKPDYLISVKSCKNAQGIFDGKHIIDSIITNHDF